MALVYVNLAYHELFVVLRALGLPWPTDDNLSAGMISVVGNFGPNVEYVPFEPGLGTSCRRLKKPTLLMLAVWT